MLTKQKQIEEQAIGWRIRLRDEVEPDWAAFTGWLEADPAHSAAYDQIALADDDAQQVLADLPDEGPTQAADKPPDGNSLHLPRRWLLAGSIAASFLAFGSYAWLGSSSAYPVETLPGERRVLALEDGSRLELNGGTKLLLDTDKPRYAQLERGEALFHIVHDAARPFEVEAGDVLLRDEGTVFNVVSDETGLGVAVSEGAVLYDPTGAATRLQPGMALHKTPNSGAVVRRIDVRAVGGWRQGRLIYNGVPVSRVAADLRRGLGVEVSAAPGVGSRPFSGIVLIEGEPRIALQRAASILGLRVRKQGEQWILVPGASETG